MESSTEAKTYHHGQLREALIAAGLTLLNEEGVAGVDLRKVARMVGVSHAAPYRHFADKRALIAAIAEHGFTQLTAQMQAALSGVAADDGRGQFMALGQAYVAFALAHPALMREMFSGLTVDRTDFPSLYAESKASFGILWGVIARTFGEPVELRTVISFASIHGLALLLIENQIPLSPDKTVDGLVAATIDTLVSGFTA